MNTQEKITKEYILKKYNVWKLPIIISIIGMSITFLSLWFDLVWIYLVTNFPIIIFANSLTSGCYNFAEDCMSKIPILVLLSGVLYFFIGILIKKIAKKRWEFVGIVLFILLILIVLGGLLIWGLSAL
ncbi:hypothetical protein JW758_02890 [Candidatus Peregrinibacteria bacterium]|nr:hypothetical protein [Candidatus Peregrinibacteria bacterium]